MTMYRMIIVGLLFCGAAGAMQEDAAPCTWKTLEGQKHRLGLSGERLGTILEQCRRSGLSAKDADALLAPVYAAQNEALPAEAVFIKVEEGLAKKVAVDRVTTAAEVRLGYLRRASQLVAVQSRAEGHGGGQRLVVRTAMALESGLPEEVLQEVFKQYGRRRYGRLGHVLEAAETLQLAGLDVRDTKQIMTDFLDRDLNRMEILRAVDYVIAERRKGRDFKAIHADLWIRSD